MFIGGGYMGTASLHFITTINDSLLLISISMMRNFRLQWVKSFFQSPQWVCSRGKSESRRWVLPNTFSQSPSAWMAILLASSYPSLSVGSSLSSVLREFFMMARWLPSVPDTGPVLLPLNRRNDPLPGVVSDWSDLHEVPKPELFLRSTRKK